MLSLTHIFLHNWHRFTHHVIPVQDSLYLAGHNGSGKSSILDAIQTVLIAHQNLIRFNSSAQTHSQRTIDSYVRGKIGEKRWLRPGNTVAYIALEFTDSKTNTYVTCGTCIEAKSEASSAIERLFFIINDALDTDLFIQEGLPLPRREIKQKLRNRRKTRTFDHVEEYQNELLNSLGGLNKRFFDLFIRALTFQPMRNIRDFVERWLLEKRSLDVEKLQNVVEQLQQLRSTAEQVQKKLYQLDLIEGHRDEAYRLQARLAENSVLVALLAVEHTQRRVVALENDIEITRQHLTIHQQDLATTDAVLSGTRQALLDVQIQLRQSDVVRRQQELKRYITEARQQADTIRNRWQKLLKDLQREMSSLQPIISQDAAHNPLDAAEREPLVALWSMLAPLTIATPPSDTLPVHIEAAIVALDTALIRSQERLFATQTQQRELRTKKTDLEQRLAQLQRGQKPYPNHIERLRDLLAPKMGKRPPLLCELLEVPEEYWQNAVEAMLGSRRFHIIVSPQFFPAAMQIVDQARKEERLYDVGIIDLDRAVKHGGKAHPGSLAEQVQPQHDFLTGYINTVLGNIICCEKLDDLRQHRRAITADVVLYSEWTMRALRPDTYTPRYIGQRATQSLIATIRTEIQQVHDALALLDPQERDLRVLGEMLNRGRTLSNLRQQFDNPLDDQPLRQQIAVWQAEHDSLDLSGVAEWQREEKRLLGIIAQEQEHSQELNQKIGRIQSKRETLKSDHQAAKRELVERNLHSQNECNRFPNALDVAQTRLSEHLHTEDLSVPIRNTESSVTRFTTQLTNEMEKLRNAALAYNFSFQFKALHDQLNEPRYKEERERLRATELPRYEQQIAQSQHEAEEELREHVIHRLREHIILARQELDRINDALNQFHFHGERYRFRSRPADDVREYYDLINDAQLLGTPGSLFKSEFYATHKATFDRFYEMLTHKPKTEQESKAQERIKDYRSYLSYDIDVIHKDGSVSRLSSIMGQTSGGETQTPFYVTIAASFAQLYYINKRYQRSMIRLVAFDEAFSKMDQDRIGATLKLLQKFGLQIITATPLERCEYLVPHICTNLVLTAVGDTVLIEPYRNYAAQLETFVTEETHDEDKKGEETMSIVADDQQKDETMVAEVAL